MGELDGFMGIRGAFVPEMTSHVFSDRAYELAAKRLEILGKPLSPEMMRTLLEGEPRISLEDEEQFDTVLALVEAFEKDIFGLTFVPM